MGQRIAHYEIVALLGSGGMGEVYLAQDVKLGRKVALKLLPTLFTTDEDRLRRFEQEACAASTLDHPNVCVIHEVGETADGQHFIVMEYVHGVTLRQHTTETRIKLGEAFDIQLTSFNRTTGTPRWSPDGRHRLRCSHKNPLDWLMKK